jgi:hypothetical protein
MPEAHARSHGDEIAFDEIMNRYAFTGVPSGTLSRVLKASTKTA